jgi:hypothetical protein
MRLKTLLKFYFATIRNVIIIFYSCFLLGTLFGSVLSSIYSTNISIGSVTRTDGGITTSWSSGIMVLAIFMIILGLLMAQKETRFLITRSVSRKEIFAANTLFLFPVAALMALLQILSIYFDGAVRSAIAGDTFRGLALDIQIFQAADMNNPLIFFLVSFSILLSMSALAYLTGTFLAKWKIPTIGVLAVSGITLLGCLVIPGFIGRLSDIFTFMYTDESSGLWIVLKHLVLFIPVMAAAFPVMRRITAAGKLA